MKFIIMLYRNFALFTYLQHQIPWGNSRPFGSLTFSFLWEIWPLLCRVCLLYLMTFKFLPLLSSTSFYHIPLLILAPIYRRRQFGEEHEQLSRDLLSIDLPPLRGLRGQRVVLFPNFLSYERRTYDTHVKGGTVWHFRRRDGVHQHPLILFPARGMKCFECSKFKFLKFVVALKFECLPL